MVDKDDLALARARVVLADVAPEIPESEVVPSARLVEDLGLDVVSVWALAAGLEKLAKVEILDNDICSATTLKDLLDHALTDVPLDFKNSAAGAATADDSQPVSVTPEAERDINVAMQDLANLFNS